MKICLVHNYYREPGGEDQVFHAEAKLLEQNGQDVLRYTADNRELTPGLRLGARMIWNQRAHVELRQLVADERPDVVHFHNTFPAISPAGYSAAKHAGAAVVQTLHNYRLICPASTLYRDGHPCEDCVPKRVRWPGVLHGCYRSSSLASGAIATMLLVHEALGTWDRSIDAYVALTEFARGKFVEGGLPERKLKVKPNFLADDPGIGPGDGNYALFVGRLTVEKGIAPLLEAWTSGDPGIPLKIAGSGPLDGLVKEAERGVGRLEWLGRRTNDEVRDLMKHAAVLVLPSLWYEGLPVTIVEAFATGLPVVGSRIGSITSLLHSGRTGVLFPPGDGRAMAAAVRATIGDPGQLARMRVAARAEFDARYTATRNYGMLMSIYRDAIADARRATSSR